MTVRGVVALALLLPAHGLAQAARTAPVAPPPMPPPYRGFTPGMSYRAFVERARALQDRDELRCQTTPRTAQVMECGVGIRDPKDTARFYLSAHFVEGNADMVSFYDSAGFGDERGPALVARTQGDLRRVFGTPRVLHAGAWQWRYGRRVVRLTWRARGAGRWLSITLTDGTVLDRIGRYTKTAAKP